jgi:hypothetical protein
LTAKDLTAAAEYAAGLVMDGYVERWVEGAIFPSEMAFLVATCITRGVDCVIESGRQDGYSTEILGQWARRSGVRIVSIDLEIEPERAAACRDRLKAFPVDLVKGSAYAEFGRWSRKAGVGSKLAFLADGPKEWPAISMMAAGTDERTAVIALHNLNPGRADRNLFESIGGRSAFYEAAIPSPGPKWQELRRRELDHTAGGAARSTKVSSLGVLPLDDKSRRKLQGLWRGEFGLHQPAFVRTLWSVGAYDLATKLYGASQRLLGR